MKKWIKRLGLVCIAVFPVLLIAASICFYTAYSNGKKSLYQAGEERAAELEPVAYQGKNYRYREELITILVMGIDKLEEVHAAEDGISGGQSDALFLLVLDPKGDQLKIIGINRDTITDVDVYSKEGYLLATEPLQITLQHGYGDGMELSCERTVKSVSKLFYGLPIHGYASFNLDAIEVLNDAVGGVTVTVPEDMPRLGFHEGDVQTLFGGTAYWYVRARDITSFDSAGRRLERQKQYLAALAEQGKKAIKKDITLPFQMYEELQKYMVTNLDADAMLYLGGQAAMMDMGDIEFFSLPGDTTTGAVYEGEAYEEFHIDEEAFFEMVLELFYEEL